MRLIIQLLFVLCLAVGTSCHLVRGFKYRKFDPKDATKFSGLPVKKGEKDVFYYNKPVESINEPWAKYLDTALLNSKTYAFLVIRNDSLLYEKYLEGWQEAQLFPSYSVAKSFTSALVGVALGEGKIKSLDEPITNYLPELLASDLRFKYVTIQHILDMRSGIRFNENYPNLFADVWKMGFSLDLAEYVKHLKVEKPPGGKFQYKSVNSQLLGMVVERAVGKHLSAYLSEKIWQPLGMESAAIWHVDAQKTETVRGFCCLNAIARDYAKFGSLYLHKGNWQGQQIMPESWVAASTSINTLIVNGFYKNQWWMNRRFAQFDDADLAESERLKTNGAIFKSEKNKYVVVPAKMQAFIAKGILGQYIYINPETNVVIVRLGKFWKFKGFSKAEAFIYDVARKI